ncbi:uncharacterized protein LOC124941124 [Impatiens glandulifera]|uniref:uncharacterized protein LOC124941124 n=1 Tax=Impatiens glandulifera TaxID=253017 RepID=UPI001FB13605|nr:uncharacterized protein LOC124941124 [Impatiens glandulifera]
MASRLYHYSNYLFSDYPNGLSPTTFHTPVAGNVAGADDTFPLMFDEKAPIFDMTLPRAVMAPLVINSTNGSFPEWTVPTLPELGRGFPLPSTPAPAPADMYCECSDHCDGFHCNIRNNLLCQLPDIMITNDYINNHVLEGKVNHEETLPEMKIGKYSAEERKERIHRYLKKRNQRNFTKTIKYECRKTLADKRVRIRGRFAKNNIHEPSTSDEELMMAEDKKHYESEFVRIEDNNMMMMKQLQDYGGDNIDDNINEFWYQEALTSLMYQQQLHPFLSH